MLAAESSLAWPLGSGHLPGPCSPGWAGGGCWDGLGVSEPGAFVLFSNRFHLTPPRSGLIKHARNSLPSDLRPSFQLRSSPSLQETFQPKFISFCDSKLLYVFPFLLPGAETGGPGGKVLQVNFGAPSPSSKFRDWTSAFLAFLRLFFLRTVFRSQQNRREGTQTSCPLPASRTHSLLHQRRFTEVHTTHSLLHQSYICHNL